MEKSFSIFNQSYVNSKKGQDRNFMSLVIQEYLSNKINLSDINKTLLYSSQKNLFNSDYNLNYLKIVSYVNKKEENIERLLSKHQEIFNASNEVNENFIGYKYLKYSKLLLDDSLSDLLPLDIHHSEHQESEYAFIDLFLYYKLIDNLQNYDKINKPIPIITQIDLISLSKRILNIDDISDTFQTKINEFNDLSFLKIQELYSTFKIKKSFLKTIPLDFDPDILYNENSMFFEKNLYDIIKQNVIEKNKYDIESILYGSSYFSDSSDMYCNSFIYLCYNLLNDIEFNDDWFPKENIISSLNNLRDKPISIPSFQVNAHASLLTSFYESEIFNEYFFNEYIPEFINVLEYRYIDAKTNIYNNVNNILMYFILSNTNNINIDHHQLPELNFSSIEVNSKLSIMTDELTTNLYYEELKTYYKSFFISILIDTFLDEYRLDKIF